MSKNAPSITIRPKDLSMFSSDVQALWATPIPTLSSPPKPLEFYRDYVSVSKPVLIRNAFPKISLDKIVEVTSVGGEEVHLNVDVTPDGHGDCIRIVNGERLFVMPECREMTLLELREGLRRQQQQQIGDKPNNDIDKFGLQTFNNEDKRESQLNGTKLVGNKYSEEDEILYYSRQVRTTV